MENQKLENIKEHIIEFFDKMTFLITDIKIESSFIKNKKIQEDNKTEDIEVIDININLLDPQILIGQQGQTLFEIQKILKLLLNKKLKENFYINLDIDGYKKKKVEYLKRLANDYADQAVIDKQEKKMYPMTSYERRVVHGELSNRKDIISESQGEGFNRYIIIKPV